MSVVALNSAPANRSQRREESGQQKLAKKSEAQKAEGAVLAFTIVGAAAAAMLYSVAPSPSSGPVPPGPIPTPVKDFLKNRVSLPEPSTPIPGICPIADRHSEWMIMKLLNQRVTRYVTNLTDKAKTTSYDKYSSPDSKDAFRYGISDGAQCARREWPQNTSDSVWHNLQEDSDGVFKFTRSTDQGSYPRLDITCSSKNDTLTCSGIVWLGKASLHPTPLDDYACEYTATETKSGTITETLGISRGDTIQETNKAPVFLNQLLYFDQKV